MLLWVGGCANHSVVNHVAKNAKGSDDLQGETFGFRRWVSPVHEPDVVIIGIHGFCGASIDYRNLGESTMRQQPRTAVYAYELRGQGNDPIHHRRAILGMRANGIEIFSHSPNWSVRGIRARRSFGLGKVWAH